jgi:hypothetical protein
MEEKMEMQLADESLDDVVGGAFNQQAISKLGLDTTTPSGKPGLTVHLTYRENSGSSHSGTEIHQIISDRTLRNYAAKPGELSVEAKTTTGEMKKLSKSDIKALLS